MVFTEMLLVPFILVAEVSAHVIAGVEVLVVAAEEIGISLLDHVRACAVHLARHESSVRG